MKAGDKCPQCKVGLVEKTEFGFTCSACPWDMTVEEVVMANKRERTEAGSYKFRPARISIYIEEPEQGEEFLRGLIVARQNNNSELFVDLIEGVNQLLEPYRQARLMAELEARAVSA